MQQVLMSHGARSAGIGGRQVLVLASVRGVKYKAMAYAICLCLTMFANELRAQFSLPAVLTDPVYTNSPFLKNRNGGQCTWYVYGRIQETLTIVPSVLKSKGIFLGNAGAWPSEAANNGYWYDTNPAPGAIAVWNAGHVAFVENVVNGVPHFTECNDTPAVGKTVVICRDARDYDGWTVDLYDMPSLSGNYLRSLPKFSTCHVYAGPVTDPDGYGRERSIWHSFQDQHRR